MFPSGVESKVEQTLKKNRSAPRPRSHRSEATLSCTACSTGALRDFSATTTASASGSSSSAEGTPITWVVRIPSCASTLAMSVAPVTSSAMTPRNGIQKRYGIRESSHRSGRSAPNPLASPFVATNQGARAADGRWPPAEWAVSQMSYPPRPWGLLQPAFWR